MKMTLLPPKMTKWVQETGANIIIRVMVATGITGKNRFSMNGRWLLNNDMETKTAYEAVRRDVWMYSSIFAIATSAAMLHSGVYKRGVSTKGGEHILDETHPITKLFDEPNFLETKEEFIEHWFWSLELSGKSYVECVPNKQNPKAMFVLDPRWMVPKRDEKNFTSGWTYTIDGRKVEYTNDQIIFMKWHNPGDPYEGLSAATPAGDSINSDINSNEYNNAFFSNSGIPSMTLETERRLTDEEADHLALRWGKNHKGSKKAHRVAVLYGGLKANVIQRSPKDMEFTKQKLINREEILAAFGVPPVLVGLLEQANYANAKIQDKLFWKQTMRPKLHFFAKKMTKEFGLDGYKLKFMFDMSGVEALQEDQEIRSRIAFNLVKAQVMTADDIRRIFYKLPPLPDGTGATIWVPTNVVPAKIMMNGVPQQQQPLNQPGQPGKPGGPNQQPKPEGQKPGANDGKPAGKENGNGSHLSPGREKELQEMITKLEDTFNDEYELNSQLLIG